SIAILDKSAGTGQTHTFPIGANVRPTWPQCKIAVSACHVVAYKQGILHWLHRERGGCLRQSLPADSFRRQVPACYNGQISHRRGVRGVPPLHPTIYFVTGPKYLSSQGIAFSSIVFIGTPCPASKMR